MEKPILFNTEMVKSILEGKKTSTRRPVKRTPSNDEPSGYGLWKEFNNSDSTWYVKDYTHACVWWTLEEYISKFAKYKVGDIMWVRETWQESECFDYNMKDQYCYKADNGTNEHAEEFNISWKPSIHMPRKAARLFLKVTDVRFERLKDITEEQAIAEGCTNGKCDHRNEDDGYCADCNNSGYTEPPQLEFLYLWNSIYYKQGYGWDENPYVWVIEFERVEV